MPKKFDFISPAVQLTEIDQSQLPTVTDEEGLYIIGTAPKGPAMQPIRIRNANDLYEVFGMPNEGGAINETWRQGSKTANTYSLYAAEQWLTTANSPVTYVRLIGEDATNQASGYVKAGWDLGTPAQSIDPSANINAYGLFICPSGATNNDVSTPAHASPAPTGSLAAIIYTKGAALTLNGRLAGQAATETTSSACAFIQSDNSSGAAHSTFKLDVWTNQYDSNALGGTEASASLTFDLDPDSTSFITKVLNANPETLNSVNFGAAAQAINAQGNYFLGEVFESRLYKLLNDVGSGSAGQQYGILFPLVSGSSFYVDHESPAKASKTGWVINRDPAPIGNTSYCAEDASKLFRIHSLHEGEYFQNNYAIGIRDLKLGTTQNMKSTFTIEVLNTEGRPVETFANLTLDKKDVNFVARRVGTQTRSWDETNKVFNMSGEFVNNSDYIRIEMSPEFEAGLSDDFALPFGYWGPFKPLDFALIEGSDSPIVQRKGIAATHTGIHGTRPTAVIITEGTDFQGGSPAVIGRNLTIELPDGSTYTLEISAGATSATNADSDDFTGATNAATEIKAALDLAVADNLLEGIIVSAVQSDGNGNLRKITLTAPSAGTALNGLTVGGTLVSNNNIFVNPTSDTPGNGQGPAEFNGGTDPAAREPNTYVSGAFETVFGRSSTTSNRMFQGPNFFTASFQWPSFNLTTQNTNGLLEGYRKKQYFGIRQALMSTQTDGDGQSNGRDFFKRQDYRDCSRLLPAGLDLYATGSSTEPSFIFTFDEVKQASNTQLFYYESGSHAGATSYTHANGTAGLIDLGIRKMVVPFFGGFDGLDITQPDPFSQTNVLGTNTVNTHYAMNTIQKAIDIASDRDQVRYNVISMPGLVNDTLLDELIDVVEDRGDALAIIDLNDSYKEKYENSGVADTTNGTVTLAVAEAKRRAYDSSYAATYFPRVQLAVNSNQITTPSSLAGLAVLAQADGSGTGPWFAPAGFNRGGLEALGFIGTFKTLTKAQRDELYQENVNPIARFGALGTTVVFGQKTLQQVDSALDRINVRRMLIYLKSRIGRIADNLLFDQNVQATWNIFTAEAGAVLEDLKANFGITEYKLVLDETTTTPDLVDRNILYAKVFVKPARAIEFIAVDFIITRSGVQF